MSDRQAGTPSNNGGETLACGSRHSAVRSTALLSRFARSCALEALCSAHRVRYAARGRQGSKTHEGSASLPCARPAAAAAQLRCVPPTPQRAAPAPGGCGACSRPACCAKTLSSGLGMTPPAPASAARSGDTRRSKRTLSSASGARARQAQASEESARGVSLPRFPRLRAAGRRRPTAPTGVERL